jgi:hypothetical protein
MHAKNWNSFSAVQQGFERLFPWFRSHIAALLGAFTAVQSARPKLKAPFGTHDLPRVPPGSTDAPEQRLRWVTDQLAGAESAYPVMGYISRDSIWLERGAPGKTLFAGASGNCVGHLLCAWRDNVRLSAITGKLMAAGAGCIDFCRKRTPRSTM